MEVKPRQPTTKGPHEWFIGNGVDRRPRPAGPAVDAQRGCRALRSWRTAWHAHEGGQTPYVTKGEGRAKLRGEPPVTIRVGDVVHTPSGEWHWHGAAPNQPMTHLSLTHGPATWGEHVSEDDYGARSRRRESDD